MPAFFAAAAFLRFHADACCRHAAFFHAAAVDDTPLP